MRGRLAQLPEIARRGYDPAPEMELPETSGHDPPRDRISCRSQPFGQRAALARGPVRTRAFVDFRISAAQHLRESGFDDVARRAGIAPDEHVRLFAALLGDAHDLQARFGDRLFPQSL